MYCAIQHRATATSGGWLVGYILHGPHRRLITASYFVHLAFQERKGATESNCNSSYDALAWPYIEPLKNIHVKSNHSDHAAYPTMTTEIQKNLEAKNAAYAAEFTKGHLPLPPGKKYLVGAGVLHPFCCGFPCDVALANKHRYDSHLYGCPHRRCCCIRHRPG